MIKKILFNSQLYKFCVHQKIYKPKSKKGLNLLLFLFSLGFINQYTKYRDYMSNIFLSQQEVADFHKNKQLQVDKKTLRYHEINIKRNKDTETAVIIGGGIVGLSQALKLLQKGYSVILIEKEQFISTKCSAFNGNIYNPYLFNPLISKYSIKTMLNNYINPTDTATQRFSFNSLLEPGGIIWLINALRLSTSDEQFDKSIQDMTKLGQIQEQEFEKIKKMGLLEKQLTAEGELSFYKSAEYGKRISQSFENAGIEFKEVDKTKFNQHDIDRHLFQNYPYVIKLDKENNLDTKQLSINTLKYCQKHYPNKFNILYGTDFKEFIMNNNRYVLGINTNKGVIYGDAFIICAGLHSKYITKKLGVTLPIMPCRGWIIESELPQSAKGSVLDKMVLKLPTLSVTNLNNKLRISGCQLIDQEYKSDDPLNEWGAQILIKQMKEQFNIDLDRQSISVRDCCRPLTPDDKIILSKLQLNRNVYVNAGHGSRGMSQCHGCAEVIYQLMKGQQNKEDYSAFDLTRFLFV
ncbi:unnamed protein product (macronuclear) [Paramecium tetraurelia]|uniref:FAD-dependent oxidoreductase domain-containing protein 1 n=1 Tax=Paramecium tetraurelia TaxID=5888 RepID=A0CQE6_PARTE|nr:uncharacterized protein GSPATT00009361001 [Paramecium tetraurelia]CAK73013.1 unnamed protein product [Paramecium tetraurelia]|eukprot:XP_001440410.1 hypothetical protein (macronuclear) [Paramecium tetraurelia strain d4-2]